MLSSKKKGGAFHVGPFGTPSVSELRQALLEAKSSAVEKGAPYCRPFGAAEATAPPDDKDEIIRVSSDGSGPRAHVSAEVATMFEESFSFS